MPFEVFRRHQRKLLTVFAILAMFGFVVSDSLPKLLSPSYGGRDQEIATLWPDGQTLTVYRSTLAQMLEQRNLANAFVSDIARFLGPRWFGDVTDRDLVDALILQREADRLGIPGGPEVGREFLELISNNRMNGDIFELKLSQLNVRVSGDQLLSDIGNQVRLKNVRALMGRPLVTPYDVFRIYRDQKERVSAKLVEIPVDKFIAQIAEPTDDEIRSLYQKYKDVLPNPDSETPGFKVPRQIQFEILAIDSNSMAQGIKDKLTETELRTAYENHKKEYEMKSELPTDLFAGQPGLTPPILRQFDDVRSTLATRLAEERAQAEITRRFDAIKDDVMIPFANDYSTAVDELEEARKQDPKATRVLPTSPSVKALAEREGMSYEITRLLSREEADQYGPISAADVGSGRSSGGQKFAEELFDPKRGLYEPEELADMVGMRYLVRKIKDVPAHIPELSEVRSDVSLEWKKSKARLLAQKSADDVAAELKKNGATIKDATIHGYRVLTVPEITRRAVGFRPGQGPFDSPIVEETAIPDVPHSGEAFRDAYFELAPGSVAVAANQPRTVFYAMVLDRREPATFAALYAENGDEYRYKMSAGDEAAQQLDVEWMGWLRQQAGLKPDWMPPDELKKKQSEDDA